MKVRVFVLLFFLTALYGYSQDTSGLDENWYIGKPIKDISFTGLRSIAPSELEALMNPFKGRIFDDSVFWEILGKLYALEYFDQIEPSVEPVYSPNLEASIIFHITERPSIGRIIFSGNSGLTRRELNEVILSRVNDIYNQSKVRVDIESITNRYLEKGYPNVTIAVSESQSADSTITLIFNITEHDRISISRIEFQGNSRFTANALRGQLSLKQRSLINDGAFQEAKLLADREAIAKYYRDRGYIDASVRDVTRTYEADSRGTNLILTFEIDEGNEFRFGGVTFTGNFIFSTEQLDKLITSRTGDIVNMTRLESDLQRVADLYYENGYIYNTIMRTPDKDIQTSTLSYTVTILERSRAYIENIIINGNVKTRDNVILREIPLEPGEIFSRTKVLDALRNLYNLQYFSTILPDTLQGSTENLMDLVFTLEEQPTTDIQFGLTFSGAADPDAFPISGLLQWNDRNLAGTGNQLGVDLNASIDSQSIAVNYTHRYIFGIPLSVGFDLSYSHTKRWGTMDNQAPFFNNDDNDKNFAFPDGFGSFEEYQKSNKMPTREYLMDYHQHSLSFGASTGYRWTTPVGIFGINGGIRMGFVVNNYDADLYRPFDLTLRDRNNTPIPRFSIWTALSLDQRDIFYDPSSGYYLYQRIGINGLLPSNSDIFRENEYFIRSDSRFQIFFTLWDVPVSENWNFKGVLAFNAALSIIFAQPGRELLIADSNKLSIDGMFNARGWRSEYSNTGLIMLDTWVELRIPLVRGILAWDFYFDAAGVETKEGYYWFKDDLGQPNFRIQNMRFSFGGGIRFTIPQFPMRLSIGTGFYFDENGAFKWKEGNIGGPMDFIFSFAISY